MANEYGEIEQLVNDVTSLDTARMTLRWALERLNSIEKEKADLKKNLTLAEETSRSLQVKEASLRESFESRNKTVEEKEDFYTKLEATMSLLGEGKLDIQQLLKKEAKLDSLRKSLENEYQEKFEELDHNQRSVIERWNARLLETESQYAGRLTEAQVKYDSLRAGLETDYQARITSLQASFRAKETELTARITALETSTREKDNKLESRRAELEAQYLSQKREAEENYRKLKNMLEAGLEEKLRSADSDHEAQVLSLENSWKTERSRLLEEQRVRDEQFQTAQAHIKEIENNFASQQEAHHNELLKMIGEQENAFRGQLAELEKEKTAKEAMVKELAAKLEQRSAAWDSEKAALEAEFGRKLAGMDSAMREKISQVETEYAGKKEELSRTLAAGRAEFEKEFQARLEMERRALAEEKSRLETEKSLREEALASAALKVKELEGVLASSNEEHHKELMEKISSGEASFREKLAGFQAEKLSYNETLNKLTDELRRRDAALLDEKKKITAEFDAKAAIYEERLAALEASFEERRRSYEDKAAALSLRLEDAAKASALEKENFKNEVARISAETGAMAEERAASIRAEYEGRKAELEKEFENRYSDRVKALEAEKARVNEALAEREKQVQAVCAMAEERAASARAAYENREAELKKEFESHYGDRVKALETEKARVNEALAEREGQLADAYARTIAADAALAEFRRKSSDERTALELRYEAETEKALKAAGEAAAAREAELRAGIITLRENLEEKDRQLSAEHDRLAIELAKVSAEANARSEERVATIRAEYESRKAELEHEFESRYGDRVKALETEKARVNEALAEREGQLNVSYAKAAELDSQVAELRRSAAEEKVALSREYSEEMRSALKQMEEDAKFRENELCSAVNVLREELTERDRLLAKEREKLVDELAKASIDAHARSEERAEAVRTEYELRLASLESSADGRIKELKINLAEKETQLEKASSDRAAAERALKDGFETEKFKWLEEKEGLAAGFEAKLGERVAGIRADYENRKAELEREFEARYGDRVKALELEKSRINEALAEREGQLKTSYAKTAELDSALAELRHAATEEKAALSRKYDQEMRAALKTVEEDAKAREAALSSAVSALRNEVAEKDRQLSVEREKLVDELSKAAMDAHARTEERAEAVRSEYELRLASLDAAAEERMRGLKEALAEKETQLEKASAERAAAERAQKEVFEAEKAKWTGEKESLASDFEVRLAERTAAIRAEYEGRKAEQEQEFEKRYGDRVKALELEKSRINEALSEREGQLTTAYAKTAGLDREIAELRRAATEEKAALSRKYDQEMRAALKAAEEDARSRENELSSAVNMLRAEVAEKDRLLAKERENLADELSKASLDAHARSEERAEAVRSEYEQRLASLQANTASQMRELKGALAEKEALLEHASADRAAAESAMKTAFEGERLAWIGEKEIVVSAFESKAAQLEAAHSARSAALETEFALRRERIESENAAHAASVHAEAAEKIEYERRNWHAERSRFENLLAETSGNFRSAQKEIENLNTGLRRAAEENSARETRFNRELMEARANYERELSFRISDAVSVQTAHLVEALEAAKAKNEEFAAALAENENSMRMFKAEAEEMRRDLEERLRSSDSEALNARRAELEKAYVQKHARLEANLAALKKEFEADFQAHRGELEGAFAIKNERLEAENRTLNESLEKLRASEEASSKRAAEIFNDMLTAAEAAQLEKMKLQQEHSENMNRAMAETVRRMNESAEEKLRMTQAELIKAQENNKDEVQLLEESFNSEKERMIEELARRDKYIETADMKMQEMELDIMKYRQNASGELIKQIAEQDARFQEVVRAEKDRREVRERAFEAELEKAKADSDARVKQLTDLLAAKEKLMADEDRVYRQKQLELDAMHSDMNLRVNKLNEDLFEQKQVLGEKEKALNEYRLKLEKEYAAKTAETEKMRGELSRAIMEYKSRK